jgi:hypothetical protein
MHEVEKRAVVEELVTVTVLECYLNGKLISEAECNAGIKSGQLRWADNGVVEPVTPKVQAINKPAPAIHAEGASTVPSPAPAPAAPVPAAPAPPPPPPAAAPAVQTNNRVAAGSSGFSNTNANAGKSFPSGQLSCSQFPSDYGAVPVDYLGLGGWISVQVPGNQKRSPGFGNIMTKVPNMCSNGNCCTEGSYCSYSCPAGYFKSQWPVAQGNSGESVGGVLCQGGKLVLTNPQSNTLCVPGAQQVKAYIENKLTQVVSLCQTNYPGDEAMTVPTEIAPGARFEIPVLDSNSYWTTKDGSKTTAQFYLNPAGVPVDQACRWGQGGSGANTGNWAPMVIGAGWNGQQAFMSLFGNIPTTQTYLNYNINTVGGSIPCKYENNQVCRYDGWTTCADALSPQGGCTIAVEQGQTLTYVLTN